jgi:hypothetical protein
MKSSRPVRPLARSFTTARTAATGRANTQQSLCKDQIAEKAEFAILSTNKFAKDQRELCTFEDVILAGPARVLVLAGIFRRQIVINHGLRISAVERNKKSAGRCQTKCWRRLCAW